MTILTIFDNFYIFWHFFAILTNLTIFDNLAQIIWDNFEKFWFLTIEETFLETCDIWDTEYNFDNWEPEFMTIIVPWQLIVTLDSIRNSCDVLHKVAQSRLYWGEKILAGKEIVELQNWI